MYGPNSRHYRSDADVPERECEKCGERDDDHAKAVSNGWECDIARRLSAAGYDFTHPTKENLWMGVMVKTVVFRQVEARKPWDLFQRTWRGAWEPVQVQPGEVYTYKVARHVDSDGDQKHVTSRWVPVKR